MLAADSEVVDVTVDPLDERQRRRRAWMRIGVPIGGVALMIAAILGIALFADQANRRGVLALSEDVLAALDGRIALAVSTYLDSPGRVLRIARDVVGEGATGERLPLANAFATGVLNEVPQIAIVSFADAAGNYVMVRRGAARGIDTKIIHNVPGPRRVTWIHRNAAGEEIARKDDPGDDYDPRTRPWYTGAIGANGVFWTDVYIFFTDRKPGITVSAPVRGTDGRRYVFGVDITLEALSTFLASLEIGTRGRAILMDDTGHVIAAPNGATLLRDTNGKLTTVTVDELDDAALTGAYDRFRIEGHGRRVITVDERRYISTATPLEIVGQAWSVLMVVPEDDFVGFVESNHRTALAMSLAIVALAALLGLLLVRQGLRADRNARLLLDRQHAISRQSAAFADLAATAELFDASGSEPPRTLTETLANVTEARRASIWRLTADGRTLHCEDSFDRDTAGHVDGIELHRDELPQFFAHLLSGEEIEVSDAAGDRRTAELHRVVMNPLGSRALLAVPVRRSGDVVGAVWLEDAARSEGAREFIRAVANMIALRMTGRPDPAAARGQTAAALPAATAPISARSFTTELAARGIDPADMEAEVHPNVAVMVLQFADPIAMASRSSAHERSLSNEIICALQEIAARHGIPYLKILGQEVVAAAGFGASDSTAALLIADTAVALRDRCFALFEEDNRPQAFRIGIDYGTAIGSPIGNRPEVFNLWGDATRMAASMAASAMPGTVQATEAAYERLRQGFLFRPRGSFYMPHVGEARTFVLAGRL